MDVEPVSQGRITIAMCTFNGAPHLSAQLASLVDQDHAAWDLWVGDDGSSDDTRKILQEFRTIHGDAHRIEIIDGPRRGAAANFLSLLRHASLPKDQPVALADQDDVWMPFKVSRALAEMARHTGPVLYGAQSIHSDATLTPIAASHAPRLPPSFVTALAKNVVSGHSTVISPEALAIVQSVADDLPHHDWWVYMLIAGAGGTIIIDDTQVLTYRQHGANTMGAHTGSRAAVVRIKQLFDGTYGRWFAANVAALRGARHVLSSPACDALAQLGSAPRAFGLRRVRVFKRLGIRRQTAPQTFALWLAVFLGRV